MVNNLLAFYFLIVNRKGDEIISKEKRIQELEMAADRIEEAMVHIAQAVEGTSDQRGAESYIIAHLRNWARGENPYDTTTIPKLIESVEDGDLCEECGVEYIKEEHKEDCQIGKDE